MRFLIPKVCQEMVLKGSWSEEEKGGGAITTSGGLCHTCEELKSGPP